MRKLSCKIIRSDDNSIVQKFISDHADITNRTTVFFNAYALNKTYSEGESGAQFCIPCEIDHWCIMDGIVTIYYKTGFELEISRIND